MMANKFLGLLRALQIQRWQEQVSMALADVLNALGGGSGGGSLGELDVVETRRAGLDQLAVGINTDLILNNIIFTRGEIAYDFNTGIYTLPANKIYELDAGGFFGAFSDATGGGLEVAWVDANTDAPLDTNISGVFTPNTSTDNIAQYPRVRALFISATVAQVKLRCVNATGTATLVGVTPAGNQAWGAIVKQLR